MPDRKPVVVHRKPHQGIASIPYPELPMPRKFRIRKEAKSSTLPPPLPEPPIEKVEKPIPVAGPKLRKLDTGPAVTEEVQYELPKSHVEEETDKVKDMGGFVIEPTDWSE